MTRLEFAKGWLFLTAQPWGKAYRSTGQTTVGGEPSPADLQAEFYYKTFGGIDAAIWIRACQIQATGESWPSVATLRQCLRDLTPEPTPSASETWGTEYITKDEFGVNLLETIHTISALHTLRRMLNLAVHQEDVRGMADLTTRYKEAKMYLANQLPTLNDDEMARVLARHPDVVAM